MKLNWGNHNPKYRNFNLHYKWKDTRHTGMVKYEVDDQVAAPVRLIERMCLDVERSTIYDIIIGWS